MVASPVFAKAHEHGVAAVNVAVEKLTILIGIEIPGDGVFGFEHMPKNAQEKKVVADVMALFKDKAQELFTLPAELGCKVGEIRLEAGQAIEGRVKDKDPVGHELHSDLDADYTLKCDKSPVGAVLKLAFLKRFPRITKVRVQVLSDATQAGLEVHNDQDPIKL